MNPYFYDKKIDISKPDSYNFYDFRVCNKKLYLGIEVGKNKITANFYEHWMIPNWHVEWKLSILNEDKTIRKQGSVVTFNTRSAGSESSLTFENDDTVDSYLHFAIDMNVTAITAKIGKTKHFPAEDMKLTVGNSRDICLHVPPEIVEYYASKLKCLLMTKRNVHLDNEDNLDDFVSLNIENPDWCSEKFTYEKLVRIAILCLKYSGWDKPNGFQMKYFYKNYKKMAQNIGRIAKADGDAGPLGAFTMLFDKPWGSDWLSVIRSCGIIEEKHHWNWKLGFFSTTRNGIEYFGCFIYDRRDDSPPFNFNVTLELKGCISKTNEDGEDIEDYETLEFCLSLNECNGQYVLSCPILGPIEELKRIGMDHDKATVLLKMRHGGMWRKCQKKCSVIRFPGVTNCKITIGDTEILVDRELILSFSTYFVETSENGSVEGEKNIVISDVEDKNAFVDLLRIVYGFFLFHVGNVIGRCSDKNVADKLVGRILVLANKYQFTSWVRYFDLMLVHWAKEKKLPQVWADNIPEIKKHLPLYELEKYHNEQILLGQYKSDVAADEDHKQLLSDLGIWKASVEQVEDCNDNNKETLSIEPVQALQSRKRPFEV